MVLADVHSNLRHCNVIHWMVKDGNGLEGI